ncbi:LytR/AlgR family response regulator transcription factor [Pedobacter insulae]|uniref:Two component transcriptional regulator, LytTR family n=1 Tax=Pedobacter insulae TaxID=414048 RepID=A0A1I2YC40_9SPHI|nr:LytTR family DNA-binding domain-containing protein [Pedobacter insulae]SFH23243.1 two component transcriptional regulator, LytTR family [Pedobacter insulae]
MITAILVDDEPINNSNLNALLSKHCKEIKVIDTATSVDEARSQILALKPDVVFLDIEMPDKNGFDLLKSFQNPDFAVVFVTAYDSYGIAAVKFSALDYLLKPINIEELKNTVKKIKQSLVAKKQHLKLDNLLHLLAHPQPYEDQKIALATQKETHLVPINEIVRCESSNNYTTFFLTNGIAHVISKPLYEYDEMLSPYGFIRCHQSHLVNKTYVLSILNEDSGYLMMSFTSKKIPIAKQRKAQVKESLIVNKSKAGDIHRHFL